MWVGRWVGRWGRWVVGVMGWVVIKANFFYLINAALRIPFPPAPFFTAVGFICFSKGGKG